MKQVTTPAILYKIYKYADKSAIGLALSPDYGKIKVFISKAFSKKGGLMTFVPGSLDFNQKESTDLHKFIGFGHDPSFYFYTQTPEIMFRLHLLFDFFNNLYDVGQTCPVFWNLCLKFNDKNYRELSLYTVFRLIKEAGLMFEPRCAKCGAEHTDMYLTSGQLRCIDCSNIGFFMNKELLKLLKLFYDNEQFKSKRFTAEEENNLLKLFCKHIDSVFGKDDIIKSYSVFLTVNQT